MKRILILFLAIFLFAELGFAQTLIQKKDKSAPAAEATVVKKNVKTAVPKGAKVIKGIVVNLFSAVSNTAVQGLSKDEAAGMAKRGELLALKSGSKLYLVVKADGRNNSEELAGFAGKEVSAIGKVVSKNGINVIVVSKFE